MHLVPIIILAAMMAPAVHSKAQDTVSIQNNLLNLPSSFFDKLNRKVSSLDDRLTKQTEKYLQRLARREAKLKKKLQAKDSLAAKNAFGEYPGRYAEFAKNLQNNSFPVDPRKAGEYLPNVDSMNLLLGFLQKSGINPLQMKEAGKSLQSLSAMQNKLKYVQEIRSYTKNRKNFLTGQLNQHGLAVQLKKMNKDVYYYGQYVQQYKSILNEPGKWEKTALQLLHKVPAFKQFAARNSFINSLFGAPDMASLASNASSSLPIPGLQTRADVMQVANVNLMTASAGGEDPLSAQLLNVKDQLKQLQSQIPYQDEDAELPDFKPNEMRTRSFLQKLEFGTNLQFGKTNALLPSAADIAGQVAYRFHQNGSAGVGASYKLGFGSIRAVSLSHQGIGFRSFMDYKIKGSFFVNGGMEYNYNAAFKELQELRDYTAWQSSALLGLSKKYKVSKKLKGNLILLYDFLHRSHTPHSQPIVFRFGYNF